VKLKRTENDPFLNFLENCEFGEILEYFDCVESLDFPFQILLD
jgi:hypothetical protein